MCVCVYVCVCRVFVLVRVILLFFTHDLATCVKLYFCLISESAGKRVGFKAARGDVNTHSEINSRQHHKPVVRL